MASYSYKYIYLVIVVILTGLLSWSFQSTSKYENILSKKYNIYCIWAVYIFFVLFIGLRPISLDFADMPVYNHQYESLLNQPFSLNLDSKYFIYNNFSSLFAAIGLPSWILFTFIDFIYFGGILLACWKLFPKNTLYSFIIYLGFFLTFSYATNAMKAGMAASMFLCAIAYWRQWLPCIIFLLLSLGFHHSMILPIVGFGVVWLYRKPNAYLIFWLICLIIAALNIRIFQYGFSLISNDTANLYLNYAGWSRFNWGFRFDFILFSAAPLLLGIYLLYKKGYKSDRYNFIFCLYTFVNAIWLLCMYANFTNRIAALSWFLMPFVLVFPFFDYKFEKHQKRDLNLIAWGNLSFTIFMLLIYYTIIVK